MTREEQNRKLATWLEPTVETWIGDGVVYQRSPLGAWWRGNGYPKEPADFYTDESASALLFDECCIRIGPMKFWEQAYLRMAITTKAADFAKVRKEAVVEAALALVELGEIGMRRR